VSNADLWVSAESESELLLLWDKLRRGQLYLDQEEAGPSGTVSHKRNKNSSDLEKQLDLSGGDSDTEKELFVTHVKLQSGYPYRDSEDAGPSKTVANGTNELKGKSSVREVRLKAPDLNSQLSMIPQCLPHRNQRARLFR
jgi:hypothetical protein